MQEFGSHIPLEWLVFLRVNQIVLKHGLNEGFASFEAQLVVLVTEGLAQEMVHARMLTWEKIGGLSKLGFNLGDVRRLSEQI